MLASKILRRAPLASQPSALLKSRIGRPTYLNKIRTAESLVEEFSDGQYLGWSG